MTDTQDIAFYQLVLSLQAAIMQQLGKVASPLTGAVERDLDVAKQTLDLLEMLQSKTAGNLTPDEKKLLEHVLYELRLNYLDEVKKGSAATPPTGTATESASQSVNRTPPDADNKS